MIKYMSTQQKGCTYDMVTATNGIGSGVNTADEKWLLVAIVMADALTINIIAEGGRQRCGSTCYQERIVKYLMEAGCIAGIAHSLKAIPSRTDKNNRLLHKKF
jgi:hypothetical protein